MDTSKNEISFEQEHDLIIETQNTCCLCGTALNFTHKVDYVTLKVQEDASCPSCMIQMRSREHILQ